MEPHPPIVAITPVRYPQILEAVTRAGGILGSDRWDLARGTTADALNAMNAERGAALLVRVLGEIERARGRVIHANGAKIRRHASPAEAAETERYPYQLNLAAEGGFGEGRDQRAPG